VAASTAVAAAVEVEARTVAAVIGNIYRYKSKGLRAQTLSPLSFPLSALPFQIALVVASR
jgi:hypothetical protein